MLSSMEKSKADFSVGIIGGGVAGMSCALWLKQLGYSPVIFDRNKQLGGELLRLERPNRWVLGMPNIDSDELARHYAGHIALEHIPALLESELTGIDRAGSAGFRVSVLLADGESVSFNFNALVVATGCKAKGPELFDLLPGFTEVYNAGLISFSPLDHLPRLTELTHKPIAVIGGGDNAHFTAKDLATSGANCSLLTRSQAKAGKSIRREILDSIEQGRILEYNGVKLTGFNLESPDSLKILFTSASESYEICVRHCFVRAGFNSNTTGLECFDVFKKLDKLNGYIQTHGSGQTSEPMIYAAGDVTGPGSQSVVNAIAQGANVAKEISQIL
ncbi:MAG: hypothetical protein CTY34_10515 [Methylobacter sp.]|nr:MAG: hypothetical protein CTY34_10515 [Methylobacter sp.]PPD17942.1 MAG: hypothetical protein CTY24_13925 [Methylobacter sp.]